MIDVLDVVPEFRIKFQEERVVDRHPIPTELLCLPWRKWRLEVYAAILDDSDGTGNNGEVTSEILAVFRGDRNAGVVIFNEICTL